jgi:hypothetical protein
VYYDRVGTLNMPQLYSNVQSVNQPVIEADTLVNYSCTQNTAENDQTLELMLRPAGGLEGDSAE